MCIGLMVAGGTCAIAGLLALRFDAKPRVVGVHIGVALMIAAYTFGVSLPAYIVNHYVILILRWACRRRLLTTPLILLTSLNGPLALLLTTLIVWSTFAQLYSEAADTTLEALFGFLIVHALLFMVRNAALGITVKNVMRSTFQRRVTKSAFRHHALAALTYPGTLAERMQELRNRSVRAPRQRKTGVSSTAVPSIGAGEAASTPPSTPDLGKDVDDMMDMVLRGVLPKGAADVSW
ncbi:hypothetical protein EON66_09960, partial [archaeon]